MRITLPVLCRADETVAGCLRDGKSGSVALAAVVAVIGGAALYGFVFGLWRSPEQALYSAIKMPAMMLTLVMISSLINILLAQVLGSGLSAAQTTTCVLLSLTLTSVLLAAVTPVMLLFVYQCPAPGEAGAMASYRVLLFGNTCAVALAGIAGNVRLYRLLREMTGSALMASRVLWSWILVTGLAGCELSWVCSPYLARPDLPVTFFNPNAFSSNFFEYLWRAVSGVLQ